MRPIYGLLEESSRLLERKASDYSSPDDSHSNFRYADAVAAPFPAEYKSYAVLIGVKLARLSQLLHVGRHIYNEGVKDSFLDLINYAALMAERWTLEQHSSAEGEQAYALQEQPRMWTDLSKVAPPEGVAVLVWEMGQMYINSHLAKRTLKEIEKGVKWMYLPEAPRATRDNG